MSKLRGRETDQKIEITVRRELWGLDHKMLPHLVRHCAWLITQLSGEVRREDPI